MSAALVVGTPIFVAIRGSFYRSISKQNLSCLQQHLATNSYSPQLATPHCFSPASVTARSIASKEQKRSWRTSKLPPARAGNGDQRRTFSTSPNRNAVEVVANPRKDEYGNDMLIDITARASKVKVIYSLIPLTVAYVESSV